MKNKFLLFCFLASALLFSQNEKGGSPLANPNSAIRNPHSTRAVVIGISDYQEKDIPDLRFADKDALAFANYLRSPAGGGLDNDHLQILTNQNATAGRVAEALDALVEQTKEGDQVIIYFSGHGDVERKTISQPGFLLCWDSPARVYMGGGTYSLAFLQEIVSTLSTQNKAKVLVVTDACHAGKLAGSQIGGSQATAANLAKQFANEVKILSCQPNEFSLEGEQWGGGRGIFSYHLVDGLFGLADRNGDGSVSVGEIDRYLEDKVTAEAAPQSQVPMLLGNKTERLATVNAAILAALQKSKAGGMPVFAATEGRGFEEEVLAKADSSIVKRYFAFKKAVAEKRFFQPENDCAEAFYASLSTEPGLAPLHGFLKRNYAAALQDESQQVMNQWLKSKVQTLSLSQKKEADKYGRYPRYLERAAELLGPKHYMYASLRARKLYFEGYVMSIYNKSFNPKAGAEILSFYRQALQWQPELPQAYLQMGNVFGCNFELADSVEFYARRVMELQPDWDAPYEMAAHYLTNFGKMERALDYIEQLTQLDSTSSTIHEAWGGYYFSLRQYAKAAMFCNHVTQTEPLNLIAHTNAALSYLYSEQLDKAEAVLNKGIRADSTYDFFYNLLSAVYVQKGRVEEAVALNKKAIGLDPKSGSNYYGFACTLSRVNRTAEGFAVLEQALGMGGRDYAFDWLQIDPDLANLRALPEWKELMKKHFPDKAKD